MVIDGEVLHVNLELVIDAASGAAVGMDVRDEEGSPALVAAFRDGNATTGEAPLALLIDNRPSNQTPEVDAALGDTMRIDATLGRAQNKAHVEGTFGLFSQNAPALVLDTTDPNRPAFFRGRWLTTARTDYLLADPLVIDTRVALGHPSTRP